jgi:hypothetical protein
MDKKETYEEREARKGGENELAGSRSGAMAKGLMRDMDRKGRQMTRKARKPQR